jgi:hypothetical protein
VGIAIVGLLIYKIGRNQAAQHISKDNSVHIKAVIINDRNYMGNQKVKPQFSYSYEFTVGGEEYTGNSHDSTLRVGDTVEVEYDKEHSNINRPLNPKN